MVLLISLFLVTIIVFAGDQWIRKHAGICYLICIGISACVISGVWLGAVARLRGFSLTLAQVFTQGGLAGALFNYIMFASAVPAKALLKRKVMSIRGELSIMASILTLGHNAAFGKTYFTLLFTQAAYMKLNILLAAVCSCVMIVIMLLLFITSFKKVRKRMKASSWKRLQRLAYVFYGLLYTHIMLLYLPSALEGKPSAVVNVILYSMVYLTYGSLRITRALEKKDRKKAITAVQILFGLAFIVLAGLVSASSASTTYTTGASGNSAASGAEDTAAEDSATGVKAVAVADDDAENMPDAETSNLYKDGTYTGAGIGYNGRLTVSVTIEDGNIADVHLKGSIDDEPYLTDAVDGVFPAMIAANSPQVDAVSNATTTSHALMEAVENALAQAASQ